MNVRARAARAVASVLTGTSLDQALAAQLAGLPANDQALLKAMVYGTVRERRLLEALAAQLLSKPLRQEPEVESLLLCGLHQLRAMRIPAHAAVGETVAAAAALHRSWAKNLLNAVLRRYQRERGALEAGLPDRPAVRLSYPDWLVEAIRRDWPQNWEAVLAAGNEQGPMTLRVNRRGVSRADYSAQLSAVGIDSEPVSEAPEALMLREARAVEELPGFADGLVSVQDAAAQLAAGLLAPASGMRVLDACAAPGGKTTHLLEYGDDLQLLALDSDPQRLQRVGDNLRRLKLDATLRVADAAQPQRWWDGKAYARILLDAPCSGTGVIRRHPDIKWLRRESDIPRMAAQQARLLRALWPLLAPDGVLLYASCSILSAEGEEVIQRFLAEQADARELPIAAGWGEPRSAGRRIAPGGAFDGFYYARLCKSP